MIEEAHGVVFHGIDQADPIDELALAGSPGFVEARQILRRDGQVGIQDHEHSPVASRKPTRTASPLPFPGCLKKPRVHVRPARDFALDRAPGIVLRVALHEDQLRSRAHCGTRSKIGWNVAFLIAGRHDHADHRVPRTGLGIGRATKKFASANQRNGGIHQILVRQTDAEAASRTATRISCEVRIGSKAGRCRRLTISPGASQFCVNWGAASPSGFRHARAAVPIAGCMRSGSLSCPDGNAARYFRRPAEHPINH